MNGAELRVTGRVQGVGYRYFCQTRASALGLTGTVENQDDGSVLLTVEGERTLIEQFIEQLRLGPSHAEVDSISVSWKPFTGKFQSFHITH